MTEAKRPVVLILGAGGVGLSLAGALAGVARVAVACRPRHAATVRRDGLVMEGVWGDRIVREIACIAGPEEAPSAPDLVIITAKGFDTRAICEEYAAVLRGSTVASLQNGIGNEEIIAEYAGTVIGGTVTTNFSVVGDGHVKAKSQSSPMVLGLWSGPDDESLQRLVALIRSAGILVEAVNDIRSAKWSKSLLNLSVNPICALLSIPVGKAADLRLRSVIEHIVSETFAVMEAGGVRTAWPSAKDYLDYLFSVQVPDFATAYPSMYYDIQAGRKTEIDLLNGYVAGQGERLGIQTPYNRCIADLIRFREIDGK
ncbi:ketopantoate reductase family protein [Methanofollis aquaemaris]|uniref:2-dehydropantoate 2-reductase n=1 Tax=Methanofollis aquaemaris TaxID=126734 RepID=A0A8A3S2X6_9EURY|nr:ketopantoate reductase family protein [Methanofollis aquaemaris]QSZ66485.1 ketopantoate reductase family protein [Methanofollis aquaemaris]